MRVQKSDIASNILILSNFLTKTKSVHDLKGEKGEDLKKRKSAINEEFKSSRFAAHA